MNQNCNTNTERAWTHYVRGLQQLWYWD